MKTLITGLAIASLGAFPAAAQCAHSMANMSHAKPAGYVAQLPMSERQDTPIVSASLVDGWLVRHLDKPVS